jgi:hypothetical protein
MKHGEEIVMLGASRTIDGEIEAAEVVMKEGEVFIKQHDKLIKAIEVMYAGDKAFLSDENNR